MYDISLLRDKKMFVSETMTILSFTGLGFEFIMNLDDMYGINVVKLTKIKFSSGKRSSTQSVLRCALSKACID